MWCKYAPLFIPTQKTPLKAFSGRMWKEGKISNALVRFHTHWAIERIIRGTYICFTKLIKPSDRWLIKEWMIGDSVITVLSCNHPRTCKSYTPHKDQGKWWLKCQLIWIVVEYFVIGMAIVNYIWHSSNSWSTINNLAICSGWAKVKLGGSCWRSLPIKSDRQLRHKKRRNWQS